MPKIKTHKGIAKRVKKTGSGKLKVNRGFANHFQTKKNSNRKRKLRKEKTLNKTYEKRYKKLIPYK
ncbi:MAG: 50S ribosomal protein L35 [Bacillota bacterium]